MNDANTAKPRIPTRHLSVRVPWHDAGWDGTVCRAPRENASCLALNRIGASKDGDLEETYAGELLDDILVKHVPPCFAERVNFLSERPQRRIARHAYSSTSEHHSHIADTAFLHPAHSAAATPFGWLLKERAWGKDWRKGKLGNDSLVERYGIESDPEHEPEEPGWLAGWPWVQGEKKPGGLARCLFRCTQAQTKPDLRLCETYAVDCH